MIANPATRKQNHCGKTARSSPLKKYATPSAFVALSIAACLLSLVGCATPLKTIGTARDAFFAGDLQTSQQMLQEVAEKNGRFSDPAELDLAIVQLAAGDVASAERRLRDLRDRFEAKASVAPLHEAVSMVTDETARKYQPAGYEQVMIRAMLAVCSLAKDGSDAESYINQAAMHQAELHRLAEERGEKLLGETFTSQPHQELAFAPYLRGVLREATHHDFDDAQRNYRLVSAIQPNFLPASEDIDRATNGVHSLPGHGALYVVALVGRGPVLEPVDAPITTAALSIASALLMRDSDQEDDVDRLPKITSVRVPAVHLPPSPIAAITIAGVNGVGVATTPIVNGQPILLGATQTVTDVANMVQTQADAEMPWTIARSFLRQAGKELAVTKARQSLGLTGNAGTIFQFATTTAWTASETADTRCWGLLPREIQVLRAELPAGGQTIELAPVGPDGFSVGPPQRVNVEITNAENTYVVVVAPNQHLHVIQSR